ncbi:MAG: hypothetical protein U0559_17795 [Anaerolineae bacterium]
MTDALGHEVMLEKAPEHIAAVGKAFFMSIDAAYLFPNIGPRVIAVGKAPNRRYYRDRSIGCRQSRV